MQHTVFTITNALLFSGVAVNASPLLPAGNGRAIAALSYDSAGCYTEATNMRVLTSSNYFDDLMTVDKCAVACSDFK